MSNPWCFYILISNFGRLRSYTGISNRVQHRLRAHNKEIKGGAKWPGSWKGGGHFLVMIHGFPNHNRVASFECCSKQRWRRRMKLNPPFRIWREKMEQIYKKKFPRCGPIHRVLEILHASTLPRYSDLQLRLEWHDTRYSAYLNDLIRASTKLQIMEPRKSQEPDNK